MPGLLIGISGSVWVVQIAPESVKIHRAFSKTLFPCMWKLHLPYNCLNKGPVQGFSSYFSPGIATPKLPVEGNTFNSQCVICVPFTAHSFWCRRHSTQRDCSCASSHPLVKNRRVAWHWPLLWCSEGFRRIWKWLKLIEYFLKNLKK